MRSEVWSRLRLWVTALIGLRQVPFTLVLRTGDALVLHTDDHLSAEGLRRISSMFETLHPGVRVVVLERIDVAGVLRNEPIFDRLHGPRPDPPDKPEPPPLRTWPD